MGCHGVLWVMGYFYGRAWGLGWVGRKSVGFALERRGDGVRRMARGGGRGWPARTWAEYYLSLGVGLEVSLV